MIILLFFIGHWYCSLFFQTFFHHRYAAHKMFTMNKFWEKVCFILSYITQGSSYLSPYAYGLLHRLHHAYTDTPNDPHSPKYDGNLFNMMWKTKGIYHEIFTGVATIPKKFYGNLPEWHSFDLFAHNWVSRVLFIIGYITFYVYFVPDGQWYWYLLLPFHFATGPIHGAIINWFAHVVGYRNYDLKDTSKNMFPCDLLMLGESLHNNHHNNPKANFGDKWYEFDPVYPVIWILNKIGIIKLRKK